MDIMSERPDIVSGESLRPTLNSFAEKLASYPRMNQLTNPSRLCLQALMIKVKESTKTTLSPNQGFGLMFDSLKPDPPIIPKLRLIPTLKTDPNSQQEYQKNATMEFDQDEIVPLLKYLGYLNESETIELKAVKLPKRQEAMSQNTFHNFHLVDNTAKEFASFDKDAQLNRVQLSSTLQPRIYCEGKLSGNKWQIIFRPELHPKAS